MSILIENLIVAKVWEDDKLQFVIKNKFTEEYADGDFTEGAEVIAFADGKKKDEGFLPDYYRTKSCKLIGKIGVNFDRRYNKIVKRVVEHPQVGWVYQWGKLHVMYIGISEDNISNEYHTFANSYGAHDLIPYGDNVDVSKPIGSTT